MKGEERTMDSREQEKPLTGRAVLFGLILFFAVVIGANLTLTMFAIGTMPGTEVTSAYRASLAFNSEIGAARAQAARKWQVNARVDRGSDGHANVRIEARDGGGAPLGGLVLAARLLRPTDARADRAFALTEPEAGIYRGAADDVAAGQWELVIEASRNDKRVFLSRNRLVLK
jgi:nitrogen fixation protein FixH